MSFATDLDRLRAGDLDFDRFAARYRKVFEGWARHYMRQFPAQRALDVNDLVQEALVVAWRAVDTWDPERGPTLLAFVRYAIGRQLRVELERVLGWPKRAGARRPGSSASAPVVPISTHTVLQRSGASQHRHRPLTIQDLIEGREPSPEDHAIVESLAATLPEWDADVLRGIARGMSSRVLATYLYDDPSRRAAYGLESPEQAARRIPHTVRRLARSI